MTEQEQSGDTCPKCKSCGECLVGHHSNCFRIGTGWGCGCESCWPSAPPQHNPDCPLAGDPIFGDGKWTHVFSKGETIDCAPASPIVPPAMAWDRGWNESPIVETAQFKFHHSTIVQEARGLIKTVCRMIWAREHGLRIGRDDAEDGSAYVMRLAHAVGLLPEINGSSFRKFCEELTGLSFAASQPEQCYDNCGEFGHKLHTPRCLEMRKAAAAKALGAAEPVAVVETAQSKLVGVIDLAFALSEEFGAVEYNKRIAPILRKLKYVAAAEPMASKLPIDRPCSACSDGDTEMKYHDHAPPFREPVAGESEGIRNAKQIAAGWRETDKYIADLKAMLEAITQDRDEWKGWTKLYKHGCEKAESERDRAREALRLIRDLVIVKDCEYIVPPSDMMREIAREALGE